MNNDYENPNPTRDEIDATRGALLLEFGTGWCEFCRGAAPHVAAARAAFPDVPHRKLEDGRGRPLGRSFQVKLWPTLIALKDGQEIARTVRPGSAAEVTEILARIAASESPGGRAGGGDVS